MDSRLWNRWFAETLKNAQTKLLAWLAAKEWARWNKIRPKRKEDLPVKALVAALKKIQHHYHFPRLSLHSPDFFHGCRMLVRFQAFFQKSKNCINALCINTTFNLANSLFTKLYQRNNVNCWINLTNSTIFFSATAYMYVMIRQKLQANIHLHPCVISKRDAIYRAIITMARFQQHNISILWTERGFLVLQ